MEGPKSVKWEKEKDTMDEGEQVDVRNFFK